ncbi:hypothetical protein NCY59_03370 [Acinetobacter radioresistens]|uniref:hypothetical protein n=1 Tax=Acinetobacter radioresistens TaxID=40216 RepID=UPI0020303CA8|nr:hypothetical protein [Acinetobacter radioresistens]MCM1934633.1 hypothetical protein [Acinetobacter radioresistens]MCM1952080.1 hypothetical protein [Acinetobacter radioresistens]
MSETNTQSSTLKESETCNILGWAIMGLGFIAGLIVVFAFGRIEITNEYYRTETIWSMAAIGTAIGIVFNGIIWGYLFQKIASLLRYHENKS